MKIMLVAAMAIVAMTPIVSHAQIITNDPINLVQNIAQVEQLVQQLTTLKQQLDTQKSQLSNMSGAAGYGSLISDSAQVIKQNLPEDWDSVYSDALSQTSVLASAATSMQNKFNSGTDGVSVSEALAMTRNALEQKSYYDRVMAQNAYDNQMKEFNDIQRLTNEIDSTSTTKEIQDLQARIQAQQGTVASEQAKLTLMANLQAAQDKIIAGQRERAVQRKAFGEQTNSPNIVD